MRQDTMQALQAFKIKTFGNQKNIEKAEEKLRQDELVHYIAPTNATIFENHTKKKETLPGVFILTNQRILFTCRVGFSETTRVIGLEEVRSIGCTGNGLTGAHVEIHTLAETLDVLVNYKRESMIMLQDIIERTMSSFKARFNAPPPGPAISDADEIMKYKQLLDMGAITPEEYEAKKKQLLGF